MCIIIGRKQEIEELNRRRNSKRAEFIAVYGRRRVGKTFLINEVFRDDMLFHHTEVEGGILVVASLNGVPNVIGVGGHDDLIHKVEGFQSLDVPAIIISFAICISPLWLQPISAIIFGAFILDKIFIQTRISFH